MANSASAVHRIRDFGFISTYRTVGVSIEQTSSGTPHECRGTNVITAELATGWLLVARYLRKADGNSTALRVSTPIVSQSEAIADAELQTVRAESLFGQEDAAEAVGHVAEHIVPHREVCTESEGEQRFGFVFE